MSHCEPAATIIDLLGGPAEVAQLVETTPKTVYCWRLDGPQGSKGFIPRKWHDKLIAFGLRKGVRLTYGSFSSLCEVPVRQAAE